MEATFNTFEIGPTAQEFLAATGYGEDDIPYGPANRLVDEGLLYDQGLHTLALVAAKMTMDYDWYFGDEAAVLCRRIAELLVTAKRGEILETIEWLVVNHGWLGVYASRKIAQSACVHVGHTCNLGAEMLQLSDWIDGEVNQIETSLWGGIAASRPSVFFAGDEPICAI
jgi:hypothetical protein